MTRCIRIFGVNLVAQVVGTLSAEWQADGKAGVICTFWGIFEIGHSAQLSKSDQIYFYHRIVFKKKPVPAEIFVRAPCCVALSGEFAAQ